MHGSQAIADSVSHTPIAFRGLQGQFGHVKHARLFFVGQVWRLLCGNGPYNHIITKP